MCLPFGGTSPSKRLSLSQDFSAVAAAPPAKHESKGILAAAWGELVTSGVPSGQAASDCPVTEVSCKLHEYAPYSGCASLPRHHLGTRAEIHAGLLTVVGFAATMSAPSGQHAAECAAAFMLGATVLSYVAGAALPQQVGRATINAGVAD